MNESKQIGYSFEVNNWGNLNFRIRNETLHSRILDENKIRKTHSIRIRTSENEKRVENSIFRGSYGKRGRFSRPAIKARSIGDRLGDPISTSAPSYFYYSRAGVFSDNFPIKHANFPTWLFCTGSVGIWSYRLRWCCFNCIVH